MKISAEELERIKQSHKAKDLKGIIKEEEDKKDDKKLINDDEGGDQNFISDMVQNHKQSEAQVKRENVYQKLREGLSNAAKKLRNAVRPVNTELRSLDNEIGGLEVDYKKIDKRVDNDKDVWDDRVKEVNKMEAETEHNDQEDNKSFIHMVKIGIFGGRRGKKPKKHMGQVDLGDAADDGKPVSYIERISHLREDRSDFHGGGREM